MNEAQIHVAKIRYFEWYSRNVWNIHRRFVQAQLSPRCTQCAISSLHSELKNGTCAKCRVDTGTDPYVDDSEQLDLVRSMESELEAHQGAGSGCFDALLLFSGGKDSTILLHRLASDFPRLRVLAVTVDTGFLSPVAVDNTMNSVKKFKVAHAFIRPDPEIFMAGFRYALTHLGPKGCYGNVDRFDGDLVHDIARHVAAAQRIPLLLSGVSRKQVQLIFGVDHYEMPRERETSIRVDTGGLLLSDMYDDEQRGYWWNPDRYDGHVARVLFPLFAWNYSEDEIKEKVAEFDLIPPSKSSPLVTNNLLLPLMGFIDIAKLGYSSFEEEFSDMIRSGKADFIQWRNIFEMTEYSGKTGWLVKKEVLAMLAALGLTPEDVGLDVMRS